MYLGLSGGVLVSSPTENKSMSLGYVCISSVCMYVYSCGTLQCDCDPSLQKKALLSDLFHFEMFEKKGKKVEINLSVVL